MSHSANLIGLLEAVRHQKPAKIRVAAEAYVASLSPADAQACRPALEAWLQAATGTTRSARCLGRYRYHGQEATAYEADGIEGMALHLGNGQMVFRVTTPPSVTPASPPRSGRRYVDADWIHDDLGLRVIEGTYAALYHLADGSWTIDHSPQAVPALATPIPD